MSETTETTIDHDAIRNWAIARGGSPAMLGGPDGAAKPVLRVAFKDDTENLRNISWEEFFQIFDEGRLAMIHGGDGDPGRTHKLVSRVEAEEEKG